MKYYIIVGEASGDIHGAKLMKGILKEDPQAEFRFWGGDRMIEIGGAENLVSHYRDSAIMGFVAVAMNLRTLLRRFKKCEDDLMAYQPDLVLFIDYAGFNLRIAKFAKKRGFKTFFYIAPKVWAWKESRVKKIRKYVDELFIIFPFEIDYFAGKG
ncbi:MAG: lipid-A-disaccharide synthase, partial [Rikenellaceae bacterium]